MDEEKFVFILGREKKLALGELESVLRCAGIDFVIEKVEENVCYVVMRSFANAQDDRKSAQDFPSHQAAEGQVNVDPIQDSIREVMEKLAGTMKIFKLIESRKIVRLDKLDISIIRIIQNSNFKTQNKGALHASGLSGFRIPPSHKATEGQAEMVAGRVAFGVSCYVPTIEINQLNGFGLSIKKQLKENGVSARFVALSEARDLSTIQTLKNRLDRNGVEFGIFSDGIGVLWALNNPEDWTKIDYGKPSADKYSGMLPPRLARMMINLAIGEVNRITNYELRITKPGGKKNMRSDDLDSSQAQNDKDSNSQQCPYDNLTIVDPFCGSGAVLLEGLRLGYDVIGSDISDKAVKESFQNVEWLRKEFSGITKRSLITKADATSEAFINLIRNKIGNHLIIVGEPYLGKPKKFAVTLAEAQKEYDIIAKLYLNFFKNIAGFQKEGLDKVVCLVFPEVDLIGSKKYSLLDLCRSEIEKLGFEVCSSYLYGRDYQVVKREIAVLNSMN